MGNKNSSSEEIQKKVGDQIISNAINNIEMTPGGIVASGTESTIADSGTESTTIQGGDSDDDISSVSGESQQGRIKILQLEREIALVNLRTEEAKQVQKTKQMQVENEGEGSLRVKIELAMAEMAMKEKLEGIILLQEKEKTEQSKQATAQLAEKVKLSREESLRIMLTENGSTEREKEKTMQAKEKTKQEEMLSLRLKAIDYPHRLSLFAPPSRSDSLTVSLKRNANREDRLSMMSVLSS